MPVSNSPDILVHQHNSIEPLQSSGWPMKLTDEVLELIDTAMITLQLGNSMSNCSSYIYAICHFALSWKCEKLLGWTFCGSAYCQLIYAQNTEKWLEWAERTCMMVFEDMVHVVRWNHCSTSQSSHLVWNKWEGLHWNLQFWGHHECWVVYLLSDRDYHSTWLSQILLCLNKLTD